VYIVASSDHAQGKMEKDKWIIFVGKVSKVKEGRKKTRKLQESER
jgi:hypothetical protein